MQSYRLYFLDQDGHIFRARDLKCANDREAIDIAYNQPTGWGVEVWQGLRKLTLPARPEPSSQAAFTLYLTRGEEVIACGHVPVSSEEEAGELAWHTFDACSDACSGYELWGPRGKIEPVAVDRWVHEIEDRLQKHVVDVEMRLRESYAAINRSRKLLEVQAALQFK